MARVTPIERGHNFLCIVNRIVIQNHPVKTVSSAYLSMKQLLCDALQSDVYSEKRKGDKTVPWDAPVLVIITSDNIKGLNLTYSCPEVR